MVDTNFSIIIHLWLDWGEKDEQFCLSSFLESQALLPRKSLWDVWEALHCQCPWPCHSSTAGALTQGRMHMWNSPALSWLQLRHLNVACGVSEIFLYLILSFFPASASSSFLTLSSGLIASVLSPVAFGGSHKNTWLLWGWCFLRQGMGRLKRDTVTSQSSKAGSDWLKCSK